uniref:HTH cro/C1-type domain-containing protein n=1 Tax=Myotis myotis TaxID=51298 RepID=A0A7J7WVJ5_MYOMY|nr:hypothetical protein mMyoMyo1_011884 [Myotis myotis]
MSNFVPKKEHLREVLIHYFILKKSAAESYRTLREAYGEHAPPQDPCERWFKRFRSGAFNVKDKGRPGQPEKSEDQQLQALDEDACQTQKQLAERLNVAQQTISDRLQAMGKVLKEGKWVPHQLNERQMENRKVISKMLLHRHKRKSFLHRIVTGDEKWIYFENPKCTKSWVDPGQPTTSTARPNRLGQKTMLCVWWDQEGVVYYELLKPGETMNTDRYRQKIINLNHALIVKRPEWARRQGKVILLHDDAPSHNSKPVKDTLKDLAWEVLTHPRYSPDLAPSDYHLFRSMAHALSEQHFKTYEEVENWVSEWFASKQEKFYWDGIHKLPERWEKCIASDGHYFE